MSTQVLIAVVFFLIALLVYWLDKKKYIDLGKWTNIITIAAAFVGIFVLLLPQEQIQSPVSGMITNKPTDSSTKASEQPISATSVARVTQPPTRTPTASVHVGSAKPIQLATPTIVATAPQPIITNSIVNSDKEEQILKQFKTASFFDGEIFVTIGDIWQGPYQINFVVGSPGRENQAFQQVSVGFATIYEANHKYEVRLVALDNEAFDYSVHVMVTKLNQNTSPVLTTTPLASATKRVISNCPIYKQTGPEGYLEMDIDVPVGEIAFINTWTFDDDKSGGVFVTITGPYRGHHKLFNGAFCGGIPTDADYEPVKQQRRQVQDTRTWDIALP